MPNIPDRSGVIALAFLVKGVVFFRPMYDSSTSHRNFACFACGRMWHIVETPTPTPTQEPFKYIPLEEVRFAVREMSGKYSSSLHTRHVWRTSSVPLASFVSQYAAVVAQQAKGNSWRIRTRTRTVLRKRDGEMGRG